MALIINGSTFSGSYNNLSDKPTIPTNTNQLTNGAGFITSATPPTSLNTVGTYAFMRPDNVNGIGTTSPGNTQSGSSLRYSNAEAYISGTPSGTWRAMGYSWKDSQANSGPATTLWVRIS